MFIEAAAQLLMAGGTLSQAVAPTEYQERQLIVFPVAYLTPIQAALADFQKSHANWRCFRIIAEAQDNDLNVTFSSPLITTADPRTDLITVGPQLKCGAGATYIVNVDGKIIRRRR